MTPRRIIAVLCERGSPALACMPTLFAGCSLSVCHDAKDLTALSPPPEGVVWIPPTKASHLIDAWPTIGTSVRWFHSFSAGVDALSDFFETSGLAAGEASIAVTNGRGAFSDSLAEYILWAMLHHCKQTERCQKNKVSSTWDHFIMPQLRGRTVGFVGFGHIATTAAPLCRALGMRVLALRHSPEPHPLADVTLASTGDQAEQNKRRVFAESDYVVCTLPSTAATLRFCDTAAFKAMKSTGVFISLGRGAVVDEEALAVALHAGTIAGAACDVFEREPLPADSPLWSCPNLLITAHNADLTEDYFEHGWSVWAANCNCWIGGEPMATPADPAKGY